MAALCLPSDHVFCDCRLSSIVQARIVRGLSATRKVCRNAVLGTTDRLWTDCRHPERLQHLSHHKSLRPAYLHDAQTIFSPNFMLHSVEMVFYRLLRKAKAIRDFLVGEPFGDQRDQLLFSAR